MPLFYDQSNPILFSLNYRQLINIYTSLVSMSFSWRFDLCSQWIILITFQHLNVSFYNSKTVNESINVALYIIRFSVRILGTKQKRDKLYTSAANLCNKSAVSCPVSSTIL